MESGLMELAEAEEVETVKVDIGGSASFQDKKKENWKKGRKCKNGEWLM